MSLESISLEKGLGVLDFAVYGNPALDWLIALAIAFGVWVGLNAIRYFGLSRLRRLAERVRVHRAAWVLQTLEGTRGLVLFLLSVYAGSLWLELPSRAESIVRGVAVLAILIQVGLWLIALVNAWLQRFREENAAQNAAAVTSMSALAFVAKLVIWVSILLLALENLGVDITALVAGLGIGGIAVALAMQNILGDLFASLTIVIDKPFVEGDFLILGDYLGAVERVGLKTTRIRSLSGEQLVFSNADLLSSRIRNYGRMRERRVVFGLGVVYQTPREKLKRIPQILRESVEAQDPVRFDRAHFQRYGAYSLDFEIVYYVLDPDYTLYMDIQQAINFAIHERFEAEGIEFAFPTRTLFIAGSDVPAEEGEQSGERT
ncbi:MAG: mechanosensitive ion channel family protein [bacterium]